MSFLLRHVVSGNVAKIKPCDPCLSSFSYEFVHQIG